MKNLLLGVTFIILAFTSCQEKPEPLPKGLSFHDEKYAFQDTSGEYRNIELDYGFVLTLGQERESGDFCYYTFLELKRNDQTIYIDSTDVEYMSHDDLYPKILKSGSNKFEILIQASVVPTKDYAVRLFIEDNKFVGHDILPTFESKPCDINKDGVREYAGFWEIPWEPSEYGNRTPYNPILFYSVTPDGLLLDSSLTIERNKKIYGEFRGFTYNEEYLLSPSVLSKFDDEIAIIQRGG